MVTSRFPFAYYENAKNARGHSFMAFLHCRKFWHLILSECFPYTRDFFIVNCDDSRIQGDIPIQFVIYNHPKTAEGHRIAVPHLISLLQPAEDHENSAAACDIGHRAYAAAKFYTERWTHIEAIFALTAVGTTARLWKYTRGKAYMDAMFGLCDDLAHRSAYVDAHSREHAYNLRDAFEKIFDEAPTKF
ncbi:MAG: hypothetical protein Q9216_005594 [Gyalolechia sp. 2 TL-2023]